MSFSRHFNRYREKQPTVRFKTLAQHLFTDIFDKRAFYISTIMCDVDVLMCSSYGSNSQQVNIGSGDGLGVLGDKPLPEPMMTDIYDAIWRH